MNLRQLRIIEHKWREHVAFFVPKRGGVCLERQYEIQLMIYIAISGSSDTIRMMCTSHVFCYQCVSEHIYGDDNISPERSCREDLRRDVVFSESALRN